MAVVENLLCVGCTTIECVLLRLALITTISPGLSIVTTMTLTPLPSVRLFGGLFNPHQPLYWVLSASKSFVWTPHILSFAPFSVTNRRIALDQWHLAETCANQQKMLVLSRPRNSPILLQFISCNEKLNTINELLGVSVAWMLHSKQPIWGREKIFLYGSRHHPERPWKRMGSISPNGHGYLAGQLKKLESSFSPQCDSPACIPHLPGPAI